MGKFDEVFSDIEGQFALSDWTSHGIETYPSNWSVTTNPSEFVVLEILPVESTINYQRLSVKGIVICQIYVQTNQGMTRVTQIADYLSELLEGKTLSNGTRLHSSAFTPIGVDEQDNSLYRADFQISFTKF